MIKVYKDPYISIEAPEPNEYDEYICWLERKHKFDATSKDGAVACSKCGAKLKGICTMDAGYIYAPYIPITKPLNDPRTFEEWKLDTVDKILL